MKTIKYYGSEYVVPDWSRFIAMDLGGEVYAFELMPMPDENGWWTRCHIRPMGRSQLVSDSGWGSVLSWRDSLVELEE